MSNINKTKKAAALRERRKARIRSQVSGTGERPRLSLFRSNEHVYAQVIDDVKGNTVVSISSFEKGSSKRASIEHCKELGKKLGERCLAKKISKIVFDRNGNQYHGRVKAFAEGARESGLQF